MKLQTVEVENFEAISLENRGFNFTKICLRTGISLKTV
ncbi:hypothetical protein KS664_003174 [Clostridium perfringens]|nr:hypothetical protein [Clostridium perfringens]